MISIRTSHLLCAFGLLAALGLAVPALAAPFGTAFTYQGSLHDAGTPASGVYDLQFTPYGVASGGAPLAPAVVLEDVTVAEGIFTVQVDFGPSFFVGDEIFLEIAVRAGTSTGGFQQLLPRQVISAVPYAHKVRMGSVTEIEIAPGAVTAPSLAVDAVGAAAIAANAIDTGKLADGAVTTAKLENLSVTRAKIAPGAVGTDEIGPNAVATSKLVDGAVTTAKLEDLSVTRPKIAPGAVGANEVDATVIQLRPTGACPSGLPLLGFDASGAIFCSNSARTIDLGVSNDDGIVLAMRDDDRPVVAYSFGFGLRIQACDDPLCTSGTPRLITSALDAGRSASIVTRSNNLALVSYVDSGAGTLNLHVCANAGCASATTRVLANLGGGAATSLALAGANPVIAYTGTFETSLQPRLFVCNASTTCDSGGTVRVLDTLPAVSVSGLALAVRASLRPLVAYAYSAGIANGTQLNLYDCTDASCSSGTARTIDGVSTDSAGDHVSIAIRADGRPILAYYGVTGADLRLYDCADVDCTSGTVRLGETTGNSGRSTSIAIRADDRPLVTHYQSAGGGVRLWDCADVNCTNGTARGIESFDTAGLMGTAIALRSDGRPVIGFLSLTGARTRVHVCGRTDCATPP